jgi:uncharacterized repeat protein (TIGR01451 family)
MRRLHAIDTAIAGAALIALLAPTPASAGPVPRTFTATQAVQADLRVRLSESPSGPVRSGGLLDYTVKVVNAGSGAAKNVRVVVSLPRGLAVIGVTPGDCAEQGSRVSCAFRSLAGGASAEISVGTIVKGDASGDLNTTVKAAAATTDPSPADNEASVTNLVRPGTDLAVKLAAPRRAEAGSLFTMAATVINHGPLKARNVRLAVGIEHSTFVTLGTACLRQNQTQSRCDLGRLGPGDQMTVTFQVRLAGTAAGVLGDFAATASADRGDTHPDDNVDIAPVKVVAPTAPTAAVPTAALLPATGLDPVPLVGLAALLLGAGTLLVAASRPRRRHSRRIL